MALGGGNNSLPPGWEQSQANGKTYYVNHTTKETTWERPSAAAAPHPPSATTQQQHYAPTTQSNVPVVVVTGGAAAPPPAYQGRTPVECNTTFWITAGLSWLVWMFAVSAASADTWFCADDGDICNGLGTFADDCEADEDYPGCDANAGLIVAQIFATVVISVAVILFSVGFCRPYDANCCSAKALGIAGGVIMIIYVILQLVAFVCAIEVKNEVSDNLIGEVTLGETFDVAVSGFVFGLIQTVVIFVFIRRAGDGPAMGACCSSNGLPARTPQVQQPSKQQYAAGV